MNLNEMDQRRAEYYDKKHSNRFVKSIGVNFYLVTTYS